MSKKKRSTGFTSLKSASGGGYSFEDKVAALLLCEMLAQIPSLNAEWSVVERLEWQAVDLEPCGDLLLLLRNSTGHSVRCACSVKSAAQINAKGCTPTLCGAFWKAVASTAFASQGGLLGLFCPVTSRIAWKHLNALCSQARTLEAGRLAEKVAAQGKAILKVHDSFRAPSAEGSSALPGHILARLVPRDFDFEEEASRSEAEAVRLCKHVLRHNPLGADRPHHLWHELLHIAGCLRVSGGKCTRQELTDQLVPRFKLLETPPAIGIPRAPERYIAHPYLLLQTAGLVGRESELARLTLWATSHRKLGDNTPILSLVAMGGMGKSALAWKWFNDVAPKDMPSLAGRLWWSFYAPDADYDAFIVRALAYTSGLRECDVHAMGAQEREDRLWHIFDQHPFLLVLDGLERILVMYNRLDPAHMLDDDVDHKTDHSIRSLSGVPEAVRRAYNNKRRLRRAANPRAGRFLRRLAQARASLYLLTTRLHPVDLELDNGECVPGCERFILEGLPPEDAWRFWQSLGMKGSKEQALTLFKSFKNYPLLIRVLAGLISRYRAAPGDLDRWMANHPSFQPALLPLINTQAHVLEFALRDLGEKPRHALHTISGLLMPPTWDVLFSLIVGPDRPCRDYTDLDEALSELEDRGLVAWDRNLNLYDMHPTVRSVVWNSLGSPQQNTLSAHLVRYFSAAPKPRFEKVECLADLNSALELFNSLVRLKYFERSVSVFRDHLEPPMFYRLSANADRIKLLEPLLRLSDTLTTPQHAHSRSYVLNALAQAYHFTGEPGRSIPLFEQSIGIGERPLDLAITFGYLSDALRPSGHLHQAEAAAREALRICRKEQNYIQEAISLFRLGRLLAICGSAEESRTSLERALAISLKEHNQYIADLVRLYMAERFLLFDDASSALPLAQHARDSAPAYLNKRYSIRAMRIYGAALLGAADLRSAEHHLVQAAEEASSVEFLEEELPALVLFANLTQKKNDLPAARDLLNRVWEPAERGPYPIFHCDALIVDAQIHRQQGDHKAAAAAATKAYNLAWCDGPPYAYHRGLNQSGELLRDLEAPVPTLPPFQASKFPPMPAMESSPQDISC